MFLGIAIFTFAIGFFLYHKKMNVNVDFSESNAAENKQGSSKNANEKNTLQDVFSVTVSSTLKDASAPPVIKITSISKIANGQITPPSPEPQPMFFLELLDGDKVVSILPFEIINYQSPPLPGEEKADARKPKNAIVNLYVSFDKNVTEARIIDGGKTIKSTMKLRNIEKTSAILDDVSLRSFMRSSAAPAPANPGKPSVKGASDGRYIDIAIIGYKFSEAQLANFHQIAQNNINTFFTVEPFKGRQNDIRFHIIDNTADLGSGTSDQIDPAKLSKALGNGACSTCAYGVALDGSPYDLTVVLINGVNMAVVNKDTNGAVVYIGTATTQMDRSMVHELAHGFGAVDEYISLTTDGPIHNNLTDTGYWSCVAGTPPASELDRFVSPNVASKYYLGCMYPNYYRTSQSSIMDTGLWGSGWPIFNPVTQYIINSGMEYYMNLDPLTAGLGFGECSLNSDSSYHSGTVEITGNTSNPFGLSRFILHIDYVYSGAVFLSGQKSDFKIKIDTTKLSNGSHKLLGSASAVLGFGGSCGGSLVVDNSSTQNDSVLPVTSITNPTATSGILRDTITFSATATDNVGVSKVEFLVDSVVVGSDLASPYEISWDTKLAAYGNHTLQIRATDTSGNIGYSQNLVVFVDNTPKDTAPPTCKISAPVANTVVSSKINVQADAADNTGIAKVELYVDSSPTPASSATKSPYSFIWDTASVLDGQHILKIIATDSAGNTTTSDPITVNVKNTSDISGDLNNDGKVDIFDFNGLIQNYGNSTCGNVADFDGDCKVDIFDFNTVVGNYGKMQ